MSALAVQAAITAPTPAVASGAAAAAEPDMGFAALLSQFADAAPGAQESKTRAPGSKDAPDAAGNAALQTLEAALAGLALYANPAAMPATASAPAGGAAAPAASPLESALAAATGALAGAVWDLSGKTPLEAQLAADPSLGLTDFQIKTFLAATGATPARTGAATLGADAAWSPLDAVKLAAAIGAATPNAAGPAAAAPAVTAAGGIEAPLPASPKLAPTTAGPVAASTPAVTPQAPPPEAPIPALSPQTAPQVEASIPAVTPQTAAAAPLQAASAPAARASTPAQAVPQRGHGGASSQPISAARGAAAETPAQPSDHGDAPISASATPARRSRDDAATQAAASAAAATFAADAPSAPVATVTLAQLPAFIASEADTLAADEPAPQTAAAGTAAPKAAGAVKELQISLDPGDLGAMTLKLRLVGGKLSVTIAVANPQTLSAIEDDRALIAARLATGSQSLDDLVIQRQSLPSSTQETRTSHASGSDNDSDSSQPDGKPDASSSNGRPPSRRSAGAGSGGAFRDLVV
jgi:flagellar hook-length control protein FliK